jgi:hypothetical protein
MLSPNQPSKPSDELAARLAATDTKRADGVLTGDVVEFCQSGVSVAIAACDVSNRPVVGRGLACRIDGSGTVRLVVRNASNQIVLHAIARGSGLAVTFTKPSTHRSIQLKAASGRTCAADSSDHRLAAVQSAALKADLVADGFEDALGARYCAYETDDLISIEFVPLHAFVQTPGPGAGNPLKS